MSTVMMLSYLYSELIGPAWYQALRQGGVQLSIGREEETRRRARLLHVGILGQFEAAQEVGRRHSLLAGHLERGDAEEAVG